MTAAGSSMGGRPLLLTVDTDAAIAAINVVDVDHYLLKPWEPPEEKLDPVIDAMLEAYTGQPDVEMVETKPIGHRWSAPSFAARDFLARNAVPYRWFASDEPEGCRLLQAANLGAERLLPVVITPDGSTLVAPSATELANAVGLSTAPAIDFYDLLVDGRRPHGWSADRDPWPLEASVPGVFVAGDVRADSVKRVASAVGEGAMAVTLAHRYLGAP